MERHLPPTATTRLGTCHQCTSLNNSTGTFFNPILRWFNFQFTHKFLILFSRAEEQQKLTNESISQVSYYLRYFISHWKVGIKFILKKFNFLFFNILINRVTTLHRWAFAAPQTVLTTIPSFPSPRPCPMTIPSTCSLAKMTAATQTKHKTTRSKAE